MLVTPIPQRGEGMEIIIIVIEEEEVEEFGRK